MRKVEQMMVQAVKEGRNFKSGNTKVASNETEAHIYLHGNHIATYYRALDQLYLSNAGWYSRTTKGRLNALLAGLGFHDYITQKDGIWYLISGAEFDGAYTFTK